MALNVHEVAALRDSIARALLSDRISASERQFLSVHEARLEQHGTHAMVTEDQRGRMEGIFGRATVVLSKGIGLPQERNIRLHKPTLEDDR